jgi:hypothetical protein
MAPASGKPLCFRRVEKINGDDLGARKGSEMLRRFFTIEPENSRCRCRWVSKFPVDDISLLDIFFTWT